MGGIGGVRAGSKARSGAGPSAPVSPEPRRRRGIRRSATAISVAVLAVALLVVGGLGPFHRGADVDRTTVLGTDPAGSLEDHPVVLSGSLQQAIASLQARLQQIPQDADSWATLGLAYVQEARVTADPSYYPKAEGALRRSLQIEPSNNFVADTGMGALAAARHDFTGALSWGEQAREINPYNGNVYGVIGDAQVELGRYDDAFATFQHMVDVKPDLASYARASYARELQGDLASARDDMQLALDAAGNPEDRAFAASQLGDLAFNSGDPARAKFFYTEATVDAPEYMPPRAGLARVAWAGGDVAGAIEQFSDIVGAYPLPEYVIALGDLDTVAGRPRDAAAQYATVRVEERLFAAAGVDVDLELALFDADHGNPARAVREATEEWHRRHSILVADALGWSLYRDGRAAEALRYARFANQLGYRNALLKFHAGMIERATGHTAAAIRDLGLALEYNPHFSILYADTARRTLDALQREDA
jgi:tetratricopeptide (TPR) repeat protein